MELKVKRRLFSVVVSSICVLSINLQALTLKESVLEALCRARNTDQIREELNDITSELILLSLSTRDNKNASTQMKIDTFNQVLQQFELQDEITYEVVKQKYEQYKMESQEETTGNSNC